MSYVCSKTSILCPNLSVLSIKKRLAAWYLRLVGLRLEVLAPPPAKCVMAAVPHTSNWDFPIGICVRNLMDIEIGFVGKSSLFVWPLGPIFRWLGGVPVDRSKSTNFVQAVANIFKERDVFRLTVAPEGTRAKVDKLKTGFYYIALEAKVPIVLVGFDWGHGIIEFNKPFWPTGDIEKDFEYIHAYFAGKIGYRPEGSFVQKKTS